MCAADIEHLIGAARTAQSNAGAPAAGQNQDLGIVTRHLPDRGEAPGVGRRDDLSTMFQPGMIMDQAADDEALGDTAWWGFERPAGEPQAPPASGPPLKLDVKPYFLVPGAPPGEERIVLRSARTTFGRANADVILADAALSAPHFQVEVVGTEFFVRDLDSDHGTLLNGHRVSHSEILAGDQLRVGETTLVFRTPGDGLAV